LPGTPIAAPTLLGSHTPRSGVRCRPARPRSYGAVVTQLKIKLRPGLEEDADLERATLPDDQEITHRLNELRTLTSERLLEMNEHHGARTSTASPSRERTDRACDLCGPAECLLDRQRNRGRPNRTWTVPAATAPSSPLQAGHRLDFAIPSGWEEQDDPSRFAPSSPQTDEIEDPHLLVGPESDDGNPTLLATTFRSTQPLDELMDNVWRGFPAVRADDTQPVTVTGQAAARSTAHGTLNGVSITAVTVIIDDGGRRHVLTLTTPASVEATAIAAYDDLLESVSLTEPLA